MSEQPDGTFKSLEYIRCPRCYVIQREKASGMSHGVYIGFRECKFCKHHFQIKVKTEMKYQAKGNCAFNSPENAYISPKMDGEK